MIATGDSSFSKFQNMPEDLGRLVDLLSLPQPLQF